MGHHSEFWSHRHKIQSAHQNLPDDITVGTARCLYQENAGQNGLHVEGLHGGALLLVFGQ